MACGMACGMDCGTKNDVNFATFFTGDAKHAENLILKHMERYPTGDPYQPVAYTVRKVRAHYYHAILTCVMKRHPYFQPSMVDYSKVQNVLSEATFTRCD
jgi:hypothetical protein